LMPVKTRTNFAETAFFYPSLKTNANGEVIIEFTVPESLTKWKMMGLAYTKDLKYALIDNELVTQKDLMVMPNIPRFLRENDKITIYAKVSNVSESDQSGVAKLQLFDALTMKPIDSDLKNKNISQSFSVKKGLSVNISWELEIPEGVQAVTYKITAQTSKHSDGEESTIPVLSNRMLVTESLPLPIRGNQTKKFTFTKLVNNKSTTLKHHKLTLEFTANPAWYAIQALPYLIEYPYECVEQIFSRYYANSIASHIANSNPKIKKVFDSWRNTPGSKALLSNLEKNQELKEVLLEETPWVLDAQDESERKRRVGLLFDLNHMAGNLESAIRKLDKLQAPGGGWVWFPGMPVDRYMTQHIITGFGHLDHLGVKSIRDDNRVWNMVRDGVSYLDGQMRKDYEYLLKHYTKVEMERMHISYLQIQYLYSRSYFMDDFKLDKRNQEAFYYYKGQAEKYWLQFNQYMQAMIALSLHRFEDKTTPPAIMKSLDEHAINSEEMGMYWKSQTEGGYYWYQAPIETQALMIEAFDEITGDVEKVDALRVWLLKQKQTQDWKTTKATTEAVYALLLKGTEWLATESNVEIKVADKIIDPKKIPGVQVEAGTGYFKTSWLPGEITNEMGNITVTKKDDGVSWGAMYWQYFEQLDKITPHETPLKLQKKLFVERRTTSGERLEPIDKSQLKVGDKVIIRIELRVDRLMEYVHMKDMRASGFEPLNVISKYKYQDGLGYYEATKDVSTNFFFSYLPKGTYVFEYPVRVTHQGDFSNGITTIQC
ncbi:MAG: alpha-2-macroglobulin family protein, partial [bacterium]